MPGVTDAPSPGGWLNLLNSRIARWLVIGVLSVSGGGGAVAIYGTFQGAQASFVCEGTLVSATQNTVAYSCLNPLPNDLSGAALPLRTNYVFVNEATGPATRLNICTATSATVACKGTSTLANVASGIVLGTKGLVSLADTGALTANSAHPLAPVVLAPRNATSGKRYLNATFQRGSGATVSGEPAAYLHIEITPCTLRGVGC